MEFKKGKWAKEIIELQHDDGSWGKIFHTLSNPYVLEHDAGVYYVYTKKLAIVPNIFCSKNTSYYLRAIELLAKYDNPECKKQLQFVVKWLKGNMLTKNVWDMGKEAKDGIYLPLSDSWKMQEDRIRDCTYRISRALEALTVRSSLVGV